MPLAPARRRRVLIGSAVVLCLALITTALVYTGVVMPTRLFAAKYDVRGIDVSHHNGTVDWPRVAEQDIDFAWIKATEGSAHVDTRFAANWAEARRAGLATGAYHFMSFESPGADQAHNMIATVPRVAGTLAPVVDLEPYGSFKGNLPPATEVRTILDPLLAKLEAHYGIAPVIYTTPSAYRAYLVDAYPDNPIWFRSVAWPPRVPDGRSWTIWQYSNRDRLKGVGSEDEAYVDMNVLSDDTDLDELVVR
ncbi:lysozyme [Nocardioides sp. YR527]|uniref:glycoside hydrolase family 25 protein n=1 Tax=Nocardioides sp. YR527 TaxID=1881028 RepID=UPI00088BAEB1|nr:GH25 family lysozyme [Nocardioides sp. YR527]SDL10245.1 lysozyme [Nocardioides sp. YR527]